MLEDIGFACPCCHYKTLGERGQYEICVVCCWEDDGDYDLKQMNGPNHITLRQRQANFEDFGACDKKSIPHVLKDGPNKFVREIPAQ